MGAAGDARACNGRARVSEGSLRRAPADVAQCRRSVWLCTTCPTARSPPRESAQARPDARVATLRSEGVVLVPDAAVRLALLDEFVHGGESLVDIRVCVRVAGTACAVSRMPAPTPASFARTCRRAPGRLLAVAPELVGASVLPDHHPEVELFSSSPRRRRRGWRHFRSRLTS